MPESEGSADSNARIVVLENTLKQLGWTPGRNLQVDYRWAMGDIQRAHALAADLVDSTPDALVAASTPSLTTIQQATHKTPIAFVAVSEPVFNGFVPSLARPGVNATGFSNLEPSIGGKWLELLKGIAPRISRVSVKSLKPGRLHRCYRLGKNLTHNGPRFTTHLFGDSAIGNVDTPSSVRVVRVRIKELLAVDLVSGDGALAFR
jgi:hypothetical protein